MVARLKSIIDTYIPEYGGTTAGIYCTLQGMIKITQPKRKKMYNKEGTRQSPREYIVACIRLYYLVRSVSVISLLPFLYLRRDIHLPSRFLTTSFGEGATNLGSRLYILGSSVPTFAYTLVFDDDELAGSATASTLRALVGLGGDG